MDGHQANPLMDESIVELMKPKEFLKCPVCEGLDTENLYSVVDHESGEEFELSQCDQCNLCWVTNPPLPNELWRYYTSTMGQSMRKQPSPLFTKLRRIRLRSDIKSASAVLSSGERVIDFGTGDGSLALELSKIGYRTEARDMYSAEEWTNSKISYKQIDVSLPMPSDFLIDGEPAKLVIMRHVLEHSPFPVELLETMKRAGVEYVVAIVPNVQSLFRKLTKENWYFWDPPRHLFHFSDSSLLAIARRVGIEVDSIKHYGIDELISSFNRYRRVRALIRGKLTKFDRLLLPVTHPTAIAAGLSSGITGVISKGVIRVRFKLQ